jgi:hypothetical protein
MRVCAQTIDMIGLSAHTLAHAAGAAGARVAPALVVRSVGV